jgi:hypothetical protein
MLLPLTYYPSRGIAYARDAAQDALALIDYDLGWKIPSYAAFEFTVEAAATSSGNYTIAAKDAAALNSPDPGEPPTRFEAREDVVVLIGETMASATLYAQVTREPQTIGTTDGTDFQRIDLPDLDVIAATVSITIGAVQYFRVFAFADSRATDAHFRLFYRGDGSAYIKLPGISEDGSEFGLKPPAGLDVIASFAVGGGVSANGFAIGAVNQYAGTDANVTAVKNTEITANGREEESLENARETAPIALRQAGGWTDDSSGLAVLKEAFPEVLAAHFVRDLVQKFKVHVYILTSGGAGPGPALAAAAPALLIEQSDLEQADVSVNDPIFSDVSIIGRVALRPGFAWLDVVKYVELAVALRCSQIARVFHEAYSDTGISDTIDLINSELSSLLPYLIGGGSFSVTADQGQISKFFSSRGDGANVSFQEFGERLDPRDLEAVQAFIAGVDLLIIDSPEYVVDPGSGGITRPISVTITQDQDIV